MRHKWGTLISATQFHVILFGHTDGLVVNFTYKLATENNVNIAQLGLRDVVQ